ncbi:MAG: [ribosomal protein S5]-alanine N-acetyltransferase [Actinomycetota bacterium]|nr:[ribosomal protein S5]-alanine N-acetyltransferase [Actinomycetota bacterium]
MRLVGERVTLIAVPHDISVAVVTGQGLPDAVAATGLTATAGWPHADSADALRPLAEHGGPGPAHGTFLVTVDDVLLGECGWLGGPDDHGDVEIGYGLAGSARGRGIGTEAVAMLAAWVETQPGVRRITADALVGNEASRRLLERLRFRADAEHPPYITYVRDAPHVDATRH